MRKQKQPQNTSNRLKRKARKTIIHFGPPGYKAQKKTPKQSDMCNTSSTGPNISYYSHPFPDVFYVYMKHLSLFDCLDIFV